MRFLYVQNTCTVCNFASEFVCQIVRKSVKLHFHVCIEYLCEGGMRRANNMQITAWEWENISLQPLYPNIHQPPTQSPLLEEKASLIILPQSSGEAREAKKKCEDFLLHMGLSLLPKVAFFEQWPSPLFLCSLHDPQRQSQPRWAVHAPCFMDTVLHYWPAFLLLAAKQG